jgi:ribonuclease HII
MSTAQERARRAQAAEQREQERLLKLHEYENAAQARGFTLIGGIDEVGRGPLVGPVVAGCVVTEEPLMLTGLDDSKRVKPELRRELAEIIKTRVTAWAVAEASVEEIERLNIHHATLLAMERALAALHAQPQYLLCDAVRIRSFRGEQLPVIKGDAKCAVIAAASILAKVHRDNLLLELDALHPAYGFAEHKGYGTPQHLAALREHGPCPAHRRTWAPVREVLPLFATLSGREPDDADES